MHNTCFYSHFSQGEVKVLLKITFLHIFMSRIHCSNSLQCFLSTEKSNTIGHTSGSDILLPWATRDVVCGAGLTKWQCERERERERAGGLSQNGTAVETSNWSEHELKAGFYDIFLSWLPSSAETGLVTTQDVWQLLMSDIGTVFLHRFFCHHLKGMSAFFFYFSVFMTATQ